MAKLDRSSKTEFVALGRVRVAEQSQRDLRDFRVDALVAEFDPNRLGYPVMNFRDNVYFVLDGQHRIAALKRWNGPGWESVQIQCEVFTGLTVAEEAEMFLRLNNVLGVTVHDKFKTSISAGRALETAVKACVEAQGLTISKHKTPGSIGSVSTLLNVYKRSDANVLGRALRIARDAYGDPGMEAQVIDGFGHLCQRYNGTLDEQEAKTRLGNARGGVKGLLNRAAEIYMRTGNARAMCVAAAAVDIINANRGKKLPSWWKTGAEEKAA